MSRLVRLPLRAPLFAKLLVVVLLAAGAAAALAAQPARDDATAPAPPANPGRGEVVSLSDGPGTPTPVAHVRDPEESLSHPDPEAAQDGPKAKAPHVAGASSDDGVSPGAPSDEEVREMLREMREGGGGPAGSVTLTKGGLARVPSNAPQAVRAVIAGGNAIADFPYIWGGGHGSFQDSGYDCSGSVSYALAAGGLLKAPMASGNFMKWGEEGRGKWITIYSNPGHMFMVVGGLRFDTSGRSGARGSRWQAAPRSFGGFVARHPPGL